LSISGVGSILGALLVAFTRRRSLQRTVSLVALGLGSLVSPHPGTFC
jgi:hypothetical protein